MNGFGPAQAGPVYPEPKNPFALSLPKGVPDPAEDRAPVDKPRANGNE